MKILITGGKNAIALKILKAFHQHQIILADYGEVPQFNATNYKILSFGVKNEDTLAHTMLNFCLNENVEAILLLHSFEITALAKASVLFNEFNIEILLPPTALITNYLTFAKTNNWAAFIAGNLIFSTQHHQTIINEAKKNNLSGVFYFNNNNKPQLSLIAI